MAGRTHKASASFTRPADTTAYAATDLVANSTTAGSVTPMTFTFKGADGQNLWLRNATLRKTKADVSNANFRLWLFSTISLTMTNGDNGVFAGSFLSSLLFEGVAIDATALVTGSGSIGTSMFRGGMLELSNPCYGLLEARAAYTPASGEVFTVDLWGLAL